MPSQPARYLINALFLTITAATLWAQPGFENYQWEPPLHKARSMEDDYANDPVGFRAQWFPKLGLPVPREDYMGVWNWFNHGAYPYNKVYDRDGSKRTYFYCTIRGQECGHDAVDWLVSFRNFGANELISPFPSGAVVYVLSAYDNMPDTYKDGSLGNNLQLVCYLDGNPNNQAEVNQLILRLSHLKQHSITVNVGDRVNAGQVLGQIGYSGATSFDRQHTHVSYRHMGVYLDPFEGRENGELRESMLFDQSWVENITTWKNTELFKHFTLNHRFYVEMRNRTNNQYTFRADQPIAAIRIIDQYGNLDPDFNVLDHPDIRYLTFSERTFYGDNGSQWTLYEVSFRWYQNAPSSLLNQEIAYLMEGENGQYSNRVFVKVVR